ncbi:MAG: hypothetical protein K8T89_18870 [Planctomycetes bacterium]|nr:hypothetical protein [Planctomycetota bacterium]
MNAPRGTSYGHSADVRMHLSVNGDVLKISHLGPDFIILRTPVEHNPTDAQISLSIDGDEKRWMVHLVNGISPEREKTVIRAIC